MEAPNEVIEYFAKMQADLTIAHSIASEARRKGFDPENGVEIKPAADVAARVEEIVGPPGISSIIRELEKEGKSREMIAFEVAKKITKGEYGKGGMEERIEQAVRTGVGILTEGVLVAPTEGISKIRIRKNPDGSNYLSMYFSGPIRSAGGTVAALAVVLGDLTRREFGIAEFRPTETELERYVEEITIYDARAARLQYKPTDDEIRHIVRNCPVCVDGEPTERIEVAVHRDLERIETNRIRGGIGLVICEGIAQKASKVMRYATKIGLDWSWLRSVVKVEKEGIPELKPLDGYLDDIVAGRPIFSYPMRAGGFRLRYGKTRATGIMAKAIHPAAMVLLDSFPAIGTQLKLERPGKGCVITPCDSIDGPIVKLSDGSVRQINSTEEAERVLPDVQEILFLGDMLTSFGDFLKSNHPLAPAGYCYEWWAADAEKKGIKEAKKSIGAEEAFKLSADTGIPLHPSYTYFWHDITAGQLKELVEWLKTGKLTYDWFTLKEMSIESSPSKRVLELLCIPHSAEKGEIKLDGNHAYALLKTLGILKEKKIDSERFDQLFNPQKDVMENVNALSGIKIKKKAPTYIGSRMGRPEKAKGREMKPSVHALFPVGFANKNRDILSFYRRMKEKGEEGKAVSVEIARMRCGSCGSIVSSPTCPLCGGKALAERTCSKCGKRSASDMCSCGGRTALYEKRNVNLVGLVDEAKKRCGPLPSELKGVKGLISEHKIPEPLEKGILRARHGITVFRDGTCRFDSTNVPLTHFIPKEVGVSVEKLREIGYRKDFEGNELKRDDQLLELFPQDILISENGIEYFLKVGAFVDDLLVSLYGLKAFYNMGKKEDLIGKLVVTLSPHTSAGVLARIVGFTRARVGYAHPYIISARRRNADGDEDSAMLLLDALLNFSRKFLPASRGGTMDAPLVLTTLIDPKEVDDEVHSMEICSSYPLEFYEACEKLSPPSDSNIRLIKNTLGTPDQYRGLLFTHPTSSINNGPIKTTYVLFENMAEKVNAQLQLESKIRAVDEKDVAERVILSHFLPDLYGNLRSFSRQIFRCVDCNSKYRRVPLVGKCRRCGGKLLLTINKGGIEKYLSISKDIVKKYGLPSYLAQRLSLLESDIASVFEDEKSKQYGLADFM
jgi:DNA polymerase II large subunit